MEQLCAPLIELKALKYTITEEIDVSEQNDIFIS
jgi:hypothetical protein